MRTLDSSYLHDPEWTNTKKDTTGSPERSCPLEEETSIDEDDDQESFNTCRVEQVPLMVLPAVHGNGRKKTTR